MNLNELVTKDYLDNVVNQIINSVNTKPSGLVVYDNKEVCEILGISSKTLQNYRMKNLISFSAVGKVIWYTQADVEEFLEKNRIKARRI